MLFQGMMGDGGIILQTIRQVALITGVGLLLTGCGTQQATRHTISVPVPQLQNNFTSSASRLWREVQPLLYPTLMTVGPRGNLHSSSLKEIPSLSNGGISKSGLTVTFRFKNQPIYSRSVVLKQFARLQAIGVPVGFVDVKSVKKVGKHRLQFQLKRAYTPFLYDWAQHTAAFVPRTLPTQTTYTKVKTTGAYKISHWGGTRLVLNPKSGKGPSITVVGETSKNVKSILAGPYVFIGLTDKAIGQLSNKSTHVLWQDSRRQYMLIPNERLKFFASTKNRQAFFNLLNPAPLLTYDKGHAFSLPTTPAKTVNKSSVPTGLTLDVPSQAKSLGQAVVQAFAKSGVQLKLVVRKNFPQDLVNGKFDIALVGATHPAPWAWTTEHFVGSTFVPPQGLNAGHFSSKTWSQDIASWLKPMHQSARLKLVQSMQHFIQQNDPYYLLGGRKNGVLVHGVSGVMTNPYMPMTWNATKWKIG